MATTTTNYGFDIPQSTDLVKDGATAIATLGQDIDTAMNTALGTKKAGMVLLNTTSFSGVTSQSINDVFSATYSNYKVVINSNLFNTLNFRYRVSGADNTTSNYNNAYYAVESRGVAEFNGFGEGATTHSITGTNCDEESFAILEIGNPFATAFTSLQAFLSAGSSTVGYKAFHIVGNGRFRATTSFTGFTFYGSSNMTGTVSVYGYNK